MHLLKLLLPESLANARLMDYSLYYLTSITIIIKWSDHLVVRYSIWQSNKLHSSVEINALTLFTLFIRITPCGMALR